MEFSTDEIRAIAINQRYLLIAVLGNIVCHLLFIFNVLPMIVGIATFIFLIMEIVFLIKQTSLEKYSTGWIVLDVIFLFIPIVGLVVLLTISSKVLKAAGLNVGLMGVSSAELEKLK